MNSSRRFREAKRKKRHLRPDVVHQKMWLSNKGAKHHHYDRSLIKGRMKCPAIEPILAVLRRAIGGSAELLEITPSQRTMPPSSQRSNAEVSDDDKE
jgi:hypothetical protein